MWPPHCFFLSPHISPSRHFDAVDLCLKARVLFFFVVTEGGRAVQEALL